MRGETESDLMGQRAWEQYCCKISFRKLQKSKLQIKEHSDRALTLPEMKHNHDAGPVFQCMLPGSEKVNKKEINRVPIRIKFYKIQ